MTIVYSSPLFQAHDTGQHPENARRLGVVEEHLAQTGLLARCQHGAVRQCEVEDLTRTHAKAQIRAAELLANSGGGQLDADTVVSPASFEVAANAAGVATAAVDAVLSGKDRNALCLIRPPGHHATQDQSMGFCLFNNVAIAARHAQSQHGVGKVLIVDWDVHHGNGTQDIFYRDESVVFFSIHRYPFYPGSGSAEETGSGAGLGATVNVPVAFGTSRGEYFSLFRRGLAKAAAKAKPDLVLISAGFDAHAMDPVGNLGLRSEDFATLTTLVQEVANTYSGGRIVSCLEGGYHPDALARSVHAHLQSLLAASTPD